MNIFLFHFDYLERKEKTRLKISLQDREASVSQKKESKLLHIYVLNYFLTADRSCRETLTIHAFGRIRNRRNFPSKTAILPFSNLFQRITVP